MDKPKLNLTTSIAYIIWAILISLGYYYTGFKPAAQFWVYAFFLTLGLGTYTGKRLFQKMPKFKC